MTRTSDYARASRAFLAQAGEELRQDDLVQASEKLWGVSAQIVKAVAERRGWRHDGHRALAQVVNDLARESGDQSLRDAFVFAQGLHFNFYEDVQPREFIERELTLIEEFVGKLERLV
jgi:hypothetical protein